MSAPPRVRGAALAVVAAAALVAGCSGGDAPGRPATLPAGPGSAGGTAAGGTVAGGTVGEVPEPLADPAAPDVDLAGLRFTEVTAEAGLDRPHSTRDLIGEDGMTGGVSVVDVDRDGRPDLFVPRVGDENSLYVNNGDGTFTDRAAAAGLTGPNPELGSGPATFFDVEGDGDLDVYLAAVGAESDRLYVNDGAGRFTDGTEAAGVLQPPPTRLRNGDQVHGVTVGDVDVDGDLDLVVVQWDTAVPESAAAAGAQREASSGDGRFDRPGDVCASTEEVRRKGIERVPGDVANRSRLWINDGDGTFTDGTAAWGLRFDQVLGFTPVLSDVTGDGFADLLVTGDACTSHLYRNDGGRRFVDATVAAGVGTDENGMGSVVRDLDRDGRPDWFVTSISFPTAEDRCPVLSSINGCSGNRVYLNDGGGRFRDATDRLGLRHGWWGWGAAVEDFANTGQLAVAQANGFAESSARRPSSENWARDYFKWFLRDPGRFWVRRGGPGAGDRGRFVEVAAQVGLADTEVGVGMAPVDHDGDGDLDLFVGRSEGPPALYRNDVPARSWLRVRLDDPSSPGNRSGLGAVVEVVPAPGDRPVVAEVQTGGSYESQKLPEVHVGLGDLDEVAEVRVRWPGGRAPQRLTGVGARQVLTVTRR